MSVRSTAVALVAAAVAAFSVSSSAAADAGHSAAQDEMDAQVQQDGVPGVLGEARDGGGVWHGASGVADRGTGRPPMPHDKFRIGSLTKPFVATVMLQLQSEGTVDLDAPVERWLPGTVRGGGQDGRQVTVRQLLGHTSGLYDFTADRRMRRHYFGPRFGAHRFDTHSPKSLVRTAMSHQRSFAPGSDWGYSNTNYVLAGMVIAKATGHSYAHEIERRIIRPLKLRDTSLPGDSPRIPRPHGQAYSTLSRGAPPAHGTRSRDGVHDVTALDPSLAGASGEMISSTGDLVRFMRALLRGDVLPPRQLTEMKSTVPADGDNRYGLGLTEHRLSCGTTVWGHEGTIQGSISTAVTTSDGSHTAAFHLNGDWSAKTEALVEAEYCG
ncbi:serine hydrolase domain-containing protein [Streptomyces marispadix]|uniref:Beta-lactamase family protein n=1 Tax=Streptomyces marispadix TaxID=2922868 RepID=A0ABS9SVK7_9ACTN|nr:serine hydrolase domain-containing protein [Streptomyces marispadix]MCH6160307.1 beta-lactamase family protein [Streptomyces marispadix]